MNAVTLIEVQAVVERDSTVGATEIVKVPYNRLCKSPLNVRRKPPTGIEGMAASIATQGLLQNLIVHEITFGVDGVEVIDAHYGVAAGQRRHAGLDLLFANGEIPADFPVPVKIVSEGEALAVSLIENHEREPMHPADQCVAFSRLVAEGKSVLDVAARFSITERAVHRCLKLANVSPVLLDLFRDDEISYDQMSALALTDDREEQERLWFKATKYQRSPSFIREAITRAEVDVSRSPLVAFVTLDAYVAAGGGVRRDLFSTADEGVYLTDPEVLNRLVLDKLVEATQAIRAEGWSWVESRTKLDSGELHKHGRLVAQTPKLSRKEKAEHRALLAKRQKAMDALTAFYEEFEGEGCETQEEAHRAAVRAAEQAIKESRGSQVEWTGEQKARAGAYVSVDYDGSLKIHRGLIRPQDKAAAKRDMVPGSSDIYVVERKPKATHGDKLCARLTAHRTVAVQAEVVRRPMVALAMLLHRMIQTVFRPGYGENWLVSACEIHVKPSRRELERAADDLSANPGWHTMNAERETWMTMIPSETAEILPWLLDQSESTLLNLMAFCVASTVDGMSRVEGPHAIDEVASVLSLDMRRYWKPTQVGYLNHVSKQRVVAVVAEAVSPEAAEPLLAMKKADAVAAAELRIAEVGWLPEMLVTREADRGDDQTAVSESAAA